MKKINILLQKQNYLYGHPYFFLIFHQTIIHFPNIFKQLYLVGNNALSRKKIKKFNSLFQVTNEKQIEIQEKTVGQFENSLYISETMHRLTASNFGAVAKRGLSTPCDSLVKYILTTKSFALQLPLLERLMKAWQ